MEKNKLIYLSLCFAFGIVITTYQPLHWGFLLLALVTTGCLVIANKYIFWNKSFIYLLLFFLFLGAARQQIAIEALNRAEEAFLNRDLILRGVIYEEPVQRQGTIDILLEVRGVGKRHDLEANAGGAKGRVLVRASEEQFSSATLPEYGDILEIRGVINTPALPSNPGQFNYRAYCKKLGIIGLVFPEDIKSTSPKSEGSFLVKGALVAKGQARKVLQATLSPEDYQIADGLLFGSTKALEENFKSDLQKAGLIHVLSVSGFHVGLVLGSILLILKFFKLDAKSKIGFALILFILAFYALMTGLRPSVIRAVLMGIFPLAGYFLGRKAYWGNSLALACLVLLVWNPANLFIAGTQLSVAATWGILYLFQPLQRVLRFLPGFIRDCMAVSLAAQLGTLPLLAYHFNSIPWAAVFINLLLIIPISGILLLLLLSLVIGIIYLPLAYLFNAAAACLIFIVKLAAWYIGQIPYISINLCSPRLWEGAVYYGAMLLIGYAYRHELFRMKVIWLIKRNKRSCLVGGIVILAVIAVNGLFYTPAIMNVTFLDVGQGDSIVMLTPEKEVLVIDTGGSVKPGEGFDPGKSILVPYLRSLGIQRVDFLILSHFHQDHIGGIPALLREFPVKRVLVSSVRKNSPEVEKLSGLFKKLDTKFFFVEAGQEIICKGGIKLRVIGPDALFTGTDSDENNNSLVLKLTYQKISYLFTGDIQQEAITRYCEKEDNPQGKTGMLKATIFKVPHHGSEGSLDPDFYKEVSPRAAVISVGRNFFGHPDKEVIRELSSQQIPVFRTDTGGAVVSLTDGKELSVFNFRKEDPLIELPGVIK